MGINLQTEQILTLKEAAKTLPQLCRGQSVHRSTLYRWINRGVRGIRLEALKVGRTLVTSREAVQRFAERLVGAELPECQSTSDRAIAAEQELERRGL